MTARRTAKKAVVKVTTLHVYHAFFYIFGVSLHVYNVKFPYDTDFIFLFLNLGTLLS